MVMNLLYLVTGKSQRQINHHVSNGSLSHPSLCNYNNSLLMSLLYSENILKKKKQPVIAIFFLPISCKYINSFNYHR